MSSASLLRKLGVYVEAGELSYDGDILQLYDLIKGGAFKNRVVAPPSFARCLIACPVEIVHEVTPIAAGSRFSIANRFLARS